MRWWEEALAAFFLLIFPGCMLWMWFPLLYTIYLFLTDPTAMLTWGTSLLSPSYSPLPSLLG